jgi:hypothetical protein
MGAAILSWSGAIMRKRWLTHPSSTLIASILFASLVGAFFRLAWRSPTSSLVYNVPIAAPFAAFFLDRWLSRPRGVRGTLLDGAVIGLALLRVFAPPLPWASGHAIFTSYAAFSASRWPLRLLASVVLLQVVCMKLFVTGGWPSMASGLLAGTLAGLARRRMR